MLPHLGAYVPALEARLKAGGGAVTTSAEALQCVAALNRAFGEYAAAMARGGGGAEGAAAAAVLADASEAFGESVLPYTCGGSSYVASLMV